MIELRPTVHFSLASSFLSTCTQNDLLCVVSPSQSISDVFHFVYGLLLIAQDRLLLFYALVLSVFLALEQAIRLLCNRKLLHLEGNKCF